MPWSRLRACKAAIASPTGLPEAGPTWSRLRSRTHTSYTYPGSTQPGTGPFHIRSCTSQTSAPDSTALPRPPSWACPGPLPRALWPPPLSRHFQPGAQRTRLGLAASGQPGRAARPPDLTAPPPLFIRAASRHDPLLGQWMKSPQMLTAFLTPGSPYHATPGSPYPGQPLQLLHTPGRSPASCRPQTSTPALPGYATIPSPGSAQHQDRTLDTRPPHSRNPSPRRCSTLQVRPMARKAEPSTSPRWTGFSRQPPAPGLAPRRGRTWGGPRPWKCEQRPPTGPSRRPNTPSRPPRLSSPLPRTHVTTAASLHTRNTSARVDSRTRITLRSWGSPCRATTTAPLGSTATPLPRPGSGPPWQPTSRSAKSRPTAVSALPRRTLRLAWRRPHPRPRPARPSLSPHRSQHHRDLHSCWSGSPAAPNHPARGATSRLPPFSLLMPITDPAQTCSPARPGNCCAWAHPGQPSPPFGPPSRTATAPRVFARPYTAPANSPP